MTIRSDGPGVEIRTVDVCVSQRARPAKLGLAARARLQVLLDLALVIGQREGLLQQTDKDGNASDYRGDHHQKERENLSSD
ncbi:MAG: hypothetical protein ABII06_19835 [Pseudomonadota bacterium]